MPMSIGELFAYHLDILGTPRRYCFELLSHFATAPHEQERLKYFASNEGQDDMRRYALREKRSVLEVLTEFPSCVVPIEYLFELIRPMQAREFSISSANSVWQTSITMLHRVGTSADGPQCRDRVRSVQLYKSSLHLTMLVVNFKTPFNRTRAGLCTTWLASLSPGTGMYNYNIQC
jgi:sulfite reductase alpha subunit-like flavoprotein